METEPQYPKTVAKVEVHQPKRTKTGPLILAACLVLALASVLFTPLIFTRAEAPAAVGSTLSTPEHIQQMESLQQAQQALGFKTGLPANLPKGNQTVGYSVVDNSVLQVEYKVGTDTLLFRAAKGKQDPSGYRDDFAHTATETDDETGTSFCYSGASETTLNLVVWTKGNFCYALMAPGGMKAEVLKQAARSLE